MVEVVLVDDHPLIVDGVRRALDADGGFVVAGVAGCTQDVLPLVRRTRPELVMLDVGMPGGGGLVCLERLREATPNVKVAMFSASCSNDLIRAAFDRGASAYITKQIHPADLPSALRQILDATVFHALVGEGTATGVYPDGITKREVEVLEALAHTGSAQAAAKSLWITVATVKFHLQNVYRKLGVNSRTEALHWAYARGLIAATPTHSPH